MRNFSLCYLFVITLIFCSSCTQKFYYQDAYKDKDLHAIQNTAKTGLYIETRFAGDAIDHLIFEIDIANNSDHDIPLSISDIALVIYDHDNNERIVAYPLRKEQILAELEATRRELKSQKKARNITNILDASLGILAVSFSGNATDFVNAASYAADVGTSVAIENRSFALIEGDIEQQNNYIDEWVLDDIIIPAGVETSYDLMFTNILVNGDAMLNAKNEHVDYSQDFIFEIIEQKR